MCNFVRASYSVLIITDWLCDHCYVQLGQNLGSAMINTRIKSSVCADDNKQNSYGQMVSCWLYSFKCLFTEWRMCMPTLLGTCAFLTWVVITSHNFDSLKLSKLCCSFEAHSSKIQSVFSAGNWQSQHYVSYIYYRLSCFYLCPVNCWVALLAQGLSKLFFFFFFCSSAPQFHFQNREMGQVSCIAEV